MARKSRRDQLEEQLTLAQVKAVYTLLDNEIQPAETRLKQEEIAESVGVDRATLYRWRTQNQAFIEFKKEVARDYLADHVGLFAKSLLSSMRGTNGAPSQKALDLYAKMMGFIKSEHSVEISRGGAKSNDELAEELAALDAELAAIDAKEDED